MLRLRLRTCPGSMGWEGGLGVIKKPSQPFDNIIHSRNIPSFELHELDRSLALACSVELDEWVWQVPRGGWF